MVAPSPFPAASRQLGFLCLAVTLIGWGINWPVMKVLLREWPPLSARGSAGIIASLLLAMLAKGNGERLTPPPHSFGILLFSAGTNVTAWMGLSTLSMLWLSVAQGALLVYSMPIWVAFIAWPILGCRPNITDMLSLALGVGGLVVLLGPLNLGADPAKLLGISLALGAAVLFAFGAVTLQRSPLKMPPMASVAWQIGKGCLPMVIGGFWFERPSLSALSLRGWVAMGYMPVGPMGICYLTWFAALRRLPATTASMATLLTPLVGIIVAALAIGELIGARELVALALTLGGVMLALKPRTATRSTSRQS